MSKYCLYSSGRSVLFLHLATAKTHYILLVCKKRSCQYTQVKRSKMSWWTSVYPYQNIVNPSPREDHRVGTFSSMPWIFHDKAQFHGKNSVNQLFKARKRNFREIYIRRKEIFFKTMRNTRAGISFNEKNVYWKD